MRALQITTGWVSVLVAALLCSGSTVHAHGAGLVTRSVNLVDGQADAMLVGTTAGALWTSDRGSHWEWICEEAIGYGQNDIATWAVSKKGTLFAGALRGLYLSRDQGCTWAAHADFAVSGAKDIQNDAQGALYVTTQRYSSVNGLFISKDDGVTFTPTAVSSDHLFVPSVRVAPSRPQRIYVAAWWFEEPARSYLFTSDDGAQTFTQRDVSAEHGGGGPFTILAVHPSDADIVIAGLTYDFGTRPSFLLRSENGGITFEKVLTGNDSFASAGFNTDGTTLWVAAGNTVYRSTDSGKTFAPEAAPTRNACVKTRGEEVFACGWSIVDGWGVGLLSDACPAKWEALLRYERIGAVKACAPGTPVHDTCTPFLAALQATVPVDLPYDAGCGDDGGMPGDGGAVQPPPKPCGCGMGGVTAPVFAVFVALLVAGRRKPLARWRLAGRRA